MYQCLYLCLCMHEPEPGELNFHGKDLSVYSMTCKVYCTLHETNFACHIHTLLYRSFACQLILLKPEQNTFLFIMEWMEN